MKRLVALTALAAMAVMSAGCSTVFKEGYGSVAGAKSIVVESQKLPEFSSIGPVTVNNITSDLGSVVPPDWLSLLTHQARMQTDGEEKFRNGKMPVTLTGTVIHLETRDTVSLAMGPESQAIVRMKCYDQNGKLLSEANVIGRARSRTSSSKEDICEGFGEAVVEWLELAMDRAEEEAEKED